MKHSHCVVLTTVPSNKVAQTVAKCLLGKKLCACVNIVPNVVSVFMWKNKMEHAKELLLMIKTRCVLFKPLCRELKKLHPYTVPELIMLPITAGDNPYLRWIDSVTVKNLNKKSSSKAKQKT